MRRSASLEESTHEKAQISNDARALRLALEDELERVRRLPAQEQAEVSAEDRLESLVTLTSQYLNQAVQQAMLMTCPMNDSGRFPLHLACDTNAPPAVISFLLQSDTTQQSVHHKDKWGDLPLHTACSRASTDPSYVEVVRMLLDHDKGKQTIHTPSRSGSLPIHTACRYKAPPEVIKMLLESDNDIGRRRREHHHSSSSPTTLFCQNMYGQLPLHVACRCNLEPESMQLLLEYDVDKETVLLPEHHHSSTDDVTTNNATISNTGGRLAIHVAYLHKACTHSLQLLLQGMIHGRMERVGLENWKHQVHVDFVGRMNAVYERDFATRDKLDMTGQAFHLLWERTILLELAIWKASCCRHLREQQQHAEEQKSGEMNDNTACSLYSMHSSLNDMHLVDAAIKHECHVKSGAEMIIPGVLGFLEDEPIATLLEQIRTNYPHDHKSN